MPWANNGEVKIYYETSGLGPDLLLVHANPFDHRLWMYQVSKFSPSYRTTSMDLRGYGRSDKPGGDFTLRDMSDDVFSVCQAAGITKTIVMGISVGGIIARQLYVDHGDLVRALILVGTGSYSNPDSRQFADKNIERYGHEGLLTYYPLHLKSLLSEQFVKSDLGKHLISQFLELAPNLNVQTIMQIYRAIKEWKDPVGSRDFVVPTLVIAGEFDNALNGSIEMSEKIPGSKHIQVAGAGHGCCLEQPAFFNSVVEEFLDTVNSSSELERRTGTM